MKIKETGKNKRYFRFYTIFLSLIQTFLAVFHFNKPFRPFLILFNIIISIYILPEDTDI